MLAVAVDAHREVVAVLEGEAEAGLNSAADAEVERQAEDARALRGRDGGGAVDRPVVDDDDVEPRVERAQLVDDAGERELLVQRRHDRDAAQLAQAGKARRRRSRDDGVRHGALTGTPRSSRSSSRRARCAYVCSSSTRSRARRPSSSACAGSASSSP